MSRRKFMALSGASAAALGFGGVLWRVGGVWWDQPAAPGRAILSEQEMKILGVIADTIFPGESLTVDPIPSATEVNVPEFIDEFLSTTMDSLTANGIRLLIHAIDEMAIGVGFGMTRFHKRSLEDRIAILKAWEESMLAHRRGAFSALKLFVCMGYCESPRALKAVGVDYSCGSLA